MERTVLFFAVDKEFLNVIQALKCYEAQVRVQLGLHLLLYRPLHTQCYIFKVGCIATAHVLLLAYVNVNFAFTRKRGIKYPLVYGALRTPAGQLTYM
jgi:hypothetical protein